MKTTPFAAAALAALGLAGPVMAQGVLAQMENEVAAVAQRTRSAVVTIEDSRALVITYDTSPLEKADIESRIKRLEAEQKLALSRGVVIEQQYRNGLVDYQTLEDARTQQAHLTAELAAEMRQRDSFGRLTPMERLQQEVQDKLELLQIDKKSQERRVEGLDQRYKAGIATQTDADAAKVKLKEISDQIEQEVRRRDAYNQLIKSNQAAGANLRGAAQADSRQLYDNVVVQLTQALTAAPCSGTGFSIGDGYIVTTADVLQGMTNPVVITDAGAKIRAKVVGVDTELNVGLVVLAAKYDIPALKLGDSANATAGHFAISIGNQYGQTNAVALNLIAGLRTEGTYSSGHFYPNLIQIGGTVGAGTSGAPLVDSRGDVIGIMAGVPQPQQEIAANPMTAQFGYTPTGANTIQGRAYIPSTYNVNLNTANTPLTYLDAIGNGAVTTGTSSAPVTYVNAISNALNYVLQPQQPALNSNAATGTGASTSTAQPPKRTAAPTSNTTKTTQTTKLTAAQANIVRSVQTNAPNNTHARWSLPIMPSTPIVTSSGFAIPINDVQSVLLVLKTGKPFVHGWIGVDLDNQEQANEKEGIVTIARTVIVKGVYAGSPAEQAGLQVGDVIASIGANKVHSVSDVRANMIKLSANDTAALTVLRNGSALDLKLKIAPRPAQPGPVITTPTRTPIRR